MLIPNIRLHPPILWTTSMKLFQRNGPRRYRLQNHTQIGLQHRKLKLALRCVTGSLRPQATSRAGSALHLLLSRPGTSISGAFLQVPERAEREISAAASARRSGGCSDPGRQTTARACALESSRQCTAKSRRIPRVRQQLTGNSLRERASQGPKVPGLFETLLAVTTF